MENVLRITSVGEEKTSTDDRAYRTVGFLPHRSTGIKSTHKERRRNIWAKGPMDSPGDSLYPDLKEGVLVYGAIQTMETEPFFIPNENGKDVHPETGEPANRAETYTSVVFEGENIRSLARSQGITPRGEPSPAESTKEAEEEVTSIASE